MRFRAVILAALAWPFFGLAGEGGEAQSMDGYFRGWADIDASGRLQSFSPDGKAHPSIAEALRNELQGVAFTPARTDAGPVAIRTYLQGGYRLVADGDGYALQLKSFHAGPKPLAQDVPQPPRRLLTMDEGSWLRASYVIDRNGTARNMLVEDAGGGSELARNVAKSMPRWRFEPESIAGTPIETAVRQEFVFYAQDRQPPILPPCPADATGRVLAPGQTSCHYRVEHVKTGETRMGRTITVP